MNKNFNLPIKQLQKLNSAIKREGMNFLGNAVRNIVESHLKKIYSTYLARRPKGNFITWEQLKNSIEIQYSSAPLGLSVFINEDIFLLNNKFREDVFSSSADLSLAHPYEFYGENSEAGEDLVGAEWREVLWNKIYSDIELFIRRNFANYLQSKVK